MSTTESHSKAAENCIDGVASVGPWPEEDTAAVCSTNTDDPNPWLVVDYGSEVDFAQIVVSWNGMYLSSVKRSNIHGTRIRLFSDYAGGEPAEPGGLQLAPAAEVPRHAALLRPRGGRRRDAGGAQADAGARGRADPRQWGGGGDADGADGGPAAARDQAAGVRL